MIPIECPKCGRGGSVPPDRLNARLVCKACHTVFHLDNTGRMVLGEPESFDMKTTKSRADEVSSLADFDLAQTWADIPAPVKYGVPAVLLIAVIWLNLGSFGGGGTDYENRAAALLRSVINNDRSRTVSLSTTEGADAAGEWFDMIHAEVEKNQVGSDAVVSSSLFAGNPEKDDAVTLLVVVTKPGGSDTQVVATIPLKRNGGSWLFDATAGVEFAKKAAAAATPASSPRR